MAELDVIIPAGGKLDDEFARVVGTHSKALIRFEGKTVLESTIEAMKLSGRVGRIVLIGSQEVLDHQDAQGADVLLQEGATGPENIFRGIDYLLEEEKNPPERTLICTCDLPFLDPKVVQRFVDACPSNRDFCVPLVSERDFAEAFPQAKATFVGLREVGQISRLEFLGVREVGRLDDVAEQQVRIDRRQQLSQARADSTRSEAVRGSCDVLSGGCAAAAAKTRDGKRP